MANPNIVNLTTIQAGNAGWALGTGLTTVLLTVGADVIVKINSIICTNIHGTNEAALSLEINGIAAGATGAVATNHLTTQVRIASTINVPADDVLVVIDKPIYLMELDVLRGGASAASCLELFASFEVINDA